MAVPDEIPQGSKEFVSVVLLSDDDLTTATVDIGLIQDSTDMPENWLPGIWPTAAVNVARTASVWDTSLAEVGYWAVWARVTDSPEILPRRYGTVRVV